MRILSLVENNELNNPNSMKTKLYALFAATLLVSTMATQAQPLFSFEGGLDGWVISGFNAKPVTLGNSAFGATHGASSLAIMQTGDGFSWNALRNNSGFDAFYNAMNAVAANESLYTLELDVTYRDVDIPNGTFLNLSLWVNSGNGFRDLHSQALTTTMEDKLVHLSIPFNSFSGNADKLNENATFYQLGIGMNGNWGTGPATVYFDSITIVPEPSTIALLSLGGLVWLTAVYRRKQVR